MYSDLDFGLTGKPVKPETVDTTLQVKILSQAHKTDLKKAYM